MRSQHELHNTGLYLCEFIFSVKDYYILYYADHSKSLSLYNVCH